MSDDRSNYRKNYGRASGEFWWTMPRAILAILAVIAAVFLIMVVTTPLTIGFGWFQVEANLRSAQHVRQTYAVAFDDAKGMDANARQACRFKQKVADAKASGDTNTATQRESQLLEIENNYDRVKGEYDAYMSDHFRGGVIRPTQLPMPYPTLEVKMDEVCAKQ